MASPRPPRHLLAIDVGNTATSTGLFRLQRRERVPIPEGVWTLATSQLNSLGAYRRFLRRRLGARALMSLDGVIVSSVVPRVDRNLALDIERLSGRRPVFVTHRSPSPVRIRYRRPAEVGADRIVNARGAWERHRGPSIVIDFGTATTFDCVTGRGEYLGGVIAPGPAISAEALFRRTAKLPMVYLEEPADILGKNTLESIRAGLYHGYRGLVKEIVARLERRIRGGAASRGGARRRRVKVFTTGGQAEWILRGVPGVDRHLPFLTLEGLYHLWTDAALP